MQRRADQPDDEIVVVAVEPVASEPDIVREARLAEALREHAVLGADAVLILLRQPLEAFRALQRIPDHPAIRGIEHAAQRTLQQHVLEIAFIADRIGAAEHVVLGLVVVIVERLAVEELAQRRDEEVRVLARGHDADAARVVRVEIERRGDAGLLERLDRFLGLLAVAERRELHEEAPIERDHLAAAPSLLGDIERRNVFARRAALVLRFLCHGPSAFVLDRLSVTVRVTPARAFRRARPRSAPRRFRSASPAGCRARGSRLVRAARRRLAKHARRGASRPRRREAPPDRYFPEHSPARDYPARSAARARAATLPDRRASRPRAPRPATTHTRRRDAARSARTECAECRHGLSHRAATRDAAGSAAPNRRATARRPTNRRFA